MEKLRIEIFDGKNAITTERMYLIEKTGSKLASIKTYNGVSEARFGTLGMRTIETDTDFNFIVEYTEDYIIRFFAQCGIEVEFFREDNK